MPKTRRRLEALANEIQALRAEQADFQAAMVAQVDGVVAASAAFARDAATAAGAVADDLDALRQSFDRERQLVSELREEVSGLNGKAGEQDQAFERSRTTLSKLERQLKEHGDELRTVTAAMLARLKVVEPGRARST